MIHRSKKSAPLILMALSFVIALLGSAPAMAAIDGVMSANASFNLTAKSGYISSPDSFKIFMWGYALGNGNMQYPGPTLIVNQGETVTIKLVNSLTVPVSIVFPGQSNVTATGGTPGLFTNEALPGGTVTYQFTATNPGTYLYQSGTNPDLQIEMGLAGTIIVRPTGYDQNAPATWRAYAHPSSAFDREVLYFLTEMDPRIHTLVETGKLSEVDTTTFFPVYWYINGRSLPDVLLPPNFPLLPTQPYNITPIMHPGDRVLLRIVGAGRDMHPLHPHGNHHRVIAVDGRLLESVPGVSGADLAYFAFTTTTIPGQTADAIFRWTGENIGWDIYGHVLSKTVGGAPAAGDPLTTNEIFVASTLAGGLNAGDPTLSVQAADSPNFPGTSSFRAILWSGGVNPWDLGVTREVVRVRRLNANPANTSFTIVSRGLEGTTTPGTWPAGTSIAYTDHGAAVPVTLPSQLALTNGQFWSGSPFLGAAGSLPPGEGGFNPNSGYFFMWHSHSEKELTNNDIFVGGMASMAIIEHPDVPITDVPSLVGHVFVP